MLISNNFSYLDRQMEEVRQVLRNRSSELDFDNLKSYIQQHTIEKRRRKENENEIDSRSSLSLHKSFPISLPLLTEEDEEKDFELVTSPEPIMMPSTQQKRSLAAPKSRTLSIKKKQRKI